MISTQTTAIPFLHTATPPHPCLSKNSEGLRVQDVDILVFSANDKAGYGGAVSVGLVEGGHAGDDRLPLEGSVVEEGGKALQLLWALLEEPGVCVCVHVCACVCVVCVRVCVVLCVVCVRVRVLCVCVCVRVVWCVCMCGVCVCVCVRERERVCVRG